MDGYSSWSSKVIRLTISGSDENYEFLMNNNQVLFEPMSLMIAKMYSLNYTVEMASESVSDVLRILVSWKDVSSHDVDLAWSLVSVYSSINERCKDMEARISGHIVDLERFLFIAYIELIHKHFV